MIISTGSEQIWAYKPGYTLGATYFSSSSRKSSDEQVQIPLGPTADTSFVVLDPAGKPLPNAKIEPWHFLVNRSYPVVPQAVLERIAVRTDANGRAALPTVPRKGLMRIQISTDRYFEYDQLAIRGTERVDIVNHEVGDASNAGSIIMLSTPAS